MKRLIIILGLIITWGANAQELKEGKLLYRIETGSIYAAKDFKKKNKEEIIYFSYENENNEIITLIIRNDAKKKLLARYVFDSLPRSVPKRIEKVDELSFTELETKLTKMRLDAAMRINMNPNGIFSISTKMHFRMIPLISDKNCKVVVLTEPNRKSSNVILGNDFFIHYDSLFEYKNIEKLHNEIIAIPFNADGAAITFHEHKSNKIISSTDICSLLLNKNNIFWSQHVVLNNENASLFDVKKEILMLMTRDEWNSLVEKMRDGQ